jgi:hypothetical protein
VLEYLKWFRETRNRCYDLNIGERDLAFAGSSSHLREKMEGLNFADVQCVVINENCARDNWSYSRFKEAGKDKDKQVANLVDEESAEDGDVEICVVEWVDTPRPISCSFLKPNEAKKDEMRYTFDVSNCDKLFDVLVQGG